MLLSIHQGSKHFIGKQIPDVYDSILALKNYLRNWSTYSHLRGQLPDYSFNHEKTHYT